MILGPSSKLPARLAVGLEAKKSSPDSNQMRPIFAKSEDFGSPVLFAVNNFGFEFKRFYRKRKRESKVYLGTGTRSDRAAGTIS